MKAIEIDGKIKTFGSVPKNWKDSTGTYFNIGDGAAFGFKDVVTPAYDGRIEELSNLHLAGDVYTYDVIERPIKESLAELKEQKINKLKYIAGKELSQTDWYIIREADSGEATPQSIKDDRAALRKKSHLIEAEINALSTKKDVVLFDINI